MMLKKYQYVRNALLLMSGSIASTLAYGQGTEVGGEFLIEEVLVTATKREVRLQDVPISISALNEDVLEDLGAEGFKDFYRSVAGLNFNQSDPGRGSFNIRGISTSVSIDDNQSPVAIYVDDLPTDDSRGGRTVQDLTLFDVQRVEVLRGPQGTLFGSGALGGAIRVITNQPQADSFAAKISSSFSKVEDGDNASSIKAMANVPIIDDKLAVRVVGIYRDGGGYIDNVATGKKDVNGSEATGYRLAAKWWINDDFDVTALVSHEESETDEFGALNTVINGERARFSTLPNTIDTEIDIYNLKFNYEMDWVSLMSSTTYSDKKTNLHQGLEAGFFGLPTTAGGPDKNEAISQEFRLTSQLDGPISWIAGAFYFKRERDVQSTFAAPGLSGVINTLEIFPFAVSGDLAQEAIIKTEDEEVALYGELTYEFNEYWAATVGLRWFENDAEYTDAQRGLFVLPSPGPLPIVPTGPISTNESKTTPKFVVTYKPSDDMTMYVSATQGYRVGGTNVPVASPTFVAPASFDSDSLWNYELGFKASLFDKRLFLSSAVYYIDWEDIQVELEVPGNSTLASEYIDNAGNATSTGLELEMVIRPWEGWEFTSAWTWNETEMQDTIPGTSPNIVKGDELPGSRDISASNSVEYSHELDQWGTLFTRFEHQYVGSGFVSFDNNRGNSAKLPSYSLSNLRVGLRQDLWSVTLFATNLSNSDKLASSNSSGAFVYQLQPRTIGVDLVLEF